MKEKFCLYEIHVATCQIFVWVLRGVLPPMIVYVSLLFFYLRCVHIYLNSYIKILTG